MSGFEVAGFEVAGFEVAGFRVAGFRVAGFEGVSVPGGVGRWLPVVAVSIAVLPVGWLCATVLYRRLRRKGVPAGTARRHAVAEVAMVAGTLPWLWMILTPLPARREVRLVPLADLADQIGTQADLLTAFFQIGGNLLVFAAFGFFATLRWRIRPLAVAGIAALGSLTVETSQYVLALGRVSSVDDVLLNTLGAWLAAWLARLLPGAPDRGEPGVPPPRER